jgi:hypothetical protein
MNVTDLNCQQGMFKLTMRSNEIACMVPPFGIKLLTKMWHFVTTSRILFFSFPEYVKLVELAMV